MRIRSVHRFACLVVALVAVRLSVFSSSARADSPIVSYDDSDRIQSRNKKFLATPTKNHKETIVYEQVPSKREIWRMPSWSEAGNLSDDGDYLVVCYFGSNLLPLDYKPDMTMLTFYKRGTLIRKVPLSELIRDFRSLRRTISHYDWGLFTGFSALHRFDVETIEGRVVSYDVTTGQPVSKQQPEQKNPLPTKTQ